jgi:Ras of Complex, Roc, domain of DAPkinase
LAHPVSVSNDAAPVKSLKVTIRDLFAHILNGKHYYCADFKERIVTLHDQPQCAFEVAVSTSNATPVLIAPKAEELQVSTSIATPLPVDVHVAVSNPEELHVSTSIAFPLPVDANVALSSTIITSNHNEMYNPKPADIKIILLGDTAVGKSRLMERFLLGEYVSHQDSTSALTLFRHATPHPTLPQSLLNVDFWDTAGYTLLT